MNSTARYVLGILLCAILPLISYSCAKRKPGGAEEITAREVRKLVRDLNSKNSTIREKAVDLLGEMETAMVIEPLIEALKDSEPRVRQKAAAALGKRRDPRAVEPLLQLTSDKNLEVARAAIEALGYIGDSLALQTLLVALQDDRSELRESAAKALGELGDPKAVGPLIAALNDRSENVQRRSAEALTEMGTPAANALVAALDSQDSKLRIRVITVLGRVGDPSVVEPLIRKLKDENLEVRKEAARALGEIGDPSAIGPLVEALTEKPRIFAPGEMPSYDVQEAASDALKKLGNTAREALVPELSSTDSAARERVARVLEEIGWHPVTREEKVSFYLAAKRWDELEKLGEQAIEGLVEALADEDPKVRDAVAKTLQKLGWQPETREERISYYLTARDWENLIAMGSSGLQAVIAVLGNTKLGLERRERAAEALGDMGDKAAVNALIAAFGEVNVWGNPGEIDFTPITSFLIKAAEALGKIKDKRAVDLLSGALEYVFKPDAGMSQFDNFALYDSELQKKEVWALGEIGDPRAVEVLIMALNSTSSGVCESAEEALGKIGDPKAVQALQQAQKDSDE
jgi:HEAT repeat protein